MALRRLDQLLGQTLVEHCLLFDDLDRLIDSAEPVESCQNCEFVARHNEVQGLVPKADSEDGEVVPFVVLDQSLVKKICHALDILISWGQVPLQCATGEENSIYVLEVLVEGGLVGLIGNRHDLSSSALYEFDVGSRKIAVGAFWELIIVVV